MERQVERCCGLDVHRDTVAACVRIGGGPGQRAQQHVQTFRTTRPIPRGGTRLRRASSTLV